MINYNRLLNINYKKTKLLLVIPLIIIILLILAYKNYAYDVFNTYAIYNDNYFINIPVDNSDIIMHGKYIKINNKLYDYNIENVSSLKVIDNINYQEYEIKLNKKYLSNQVMKLTIYYNKERIIKKLLKFLF